MRRGLAIVVVLLVAIPSVALAAEGQRPTRVVELGDSYSAGEGLLPEDELEYECGTDLHRGDYYEGTNVPAWPPFWWGKACDTAPRLGPVRSRPTRSYENLCHRHARAYPNRIREGLGIAPRDAIFLACSGALTANIGAGGEVVPQYPDSPWGVPGGREQLAEARAFAAGGPPDLLTVGIGGNDAGFSSIVVKCITSNCVEQGYRREVEATIDGPMRSKVRSTLLGLRDAFPAATIVVFGYPSVVDEPKPCLRAIGVRTREFRWIKETVLVEINRAIEEDAEAAEASYVDITPATAGHGVCSDRPWINGVRFGDDIAPIPWVRVVGNESFHPSQRAHDAIAAYFLERYTDGEGRLLITNPPQT